MYKLFENAANWVANYLENRRQVTVIEDTKSDYCKINCGIPQCSVLGPTLFLIYVSDLAPVIKKLDPIFLMQTILISFL